MSLSQSDWLGAAYRTLVDRLGRDRVIVIAEVAEVLNCLETSAATGLPPYSPTLSDEQNMNLWRATHRRVRDNLQVIMDDGGPDYGGEDVNVETVIRVLEGRPREGIERVVPANTGVESLFFAIYSHGGSHPSHERGADVPYTTKCDLCSPPRPHPWPKRLRSRLHQGLHGGTFKGRALNRRCVQRWEHTDMKHSHCSTNSREWCIALPHRCKVGGRGSVAEGGIGRQWDVVLWSCCVYWVVLGGIWHHWVALVG